MGMFDTIIVSRKLPLSKELRKAFPDTDWSKEDFQTKDLQENMQTYHLNSKGLFHVKIEGEYVRTMTEEEEKKEKKTKKWVWPYEFREDSRKLIKQYVTQTVNFYHTVNDKAGNTWWIEFEAIFTKGKLTDLKLDRAEIMTTAEDNAANEKKWKDSLEAYERHPWTKTKKILNKATFGYWSRFWGNKVSGALYWVSQRIIKVQLWIIRNIA
jgi:hypothetical protein